MADRVNTLKTYNPKKVSVVLGNHIVVGYAEDSFINLEYDGDGTTHVVGADGEVVRSMDPSTMYKLTLTLLQTSETNAWLQNKYASDQKNNKATFPVTIRDILGEEEFKAEAAWVVKPGQFQRNKTAQSRAWEISCFNGELKNE